jgi:hypothetical protein
MSKGAIAEGKFTFGDAKFTVFGAGAGLDTTIVAIGEEFGTKAIEPVSTLIGTLAGLHLGGAAIELGARLVTAATAIITAGDGAMDGIAEIRLWGEVIKTASVDLVT